MDETPFVKRLFESIMAKSQGMYTFPAHILCSATTRRRHPAARRHPTSSTASHYNVNEKNPFPTLIFLIDTFTKLLTDSLIIWNYTPKFTSNRMTLLSAFIVDINCITYSSWIGWLIAWFCTQLVDRLHDTQSVDRLTDRMVCTY